MSRQTRKDLQEEMTPKTVFINARLIDPTKDSDLPGSLLVEDGVIADIGADIAVPDDAGVVDCLGLYLAPGIVDIGVKS